MKKMSQFPTNRKKPSSSFSTKRKFYTTTEDTTDLETTVPAFSSSRGIMSAARGGEEALRNWGERREEMEMGAEEEEEEEEEGGKNIFDLEERGRRRDLLDSVGFYLEGCLNRKNSVTSRRRNMKSLFYLTAVPENRGSLRKALESSSLSHRFFKVLSTLREVSDEKLHFWGYSLVVSLFCSVHDEKPSSTCQSHLNKRCSVGESCKDGALLSLSFEWFQLVIDICMKMAKVFPVAMTAGNTLPNHNMMLSPSPNRSECDSSHTSHATDTNTTPHSKTTKAISKTNKFLSKRRRARPTPTPSPQESAKDFTPSSSMSAKLNFSETVTAATHEMTCDSYSSSGGRRRFVSDNKFRNKRKFSSPEILLDEGEKIKSSALCDLSPSFLGNMMTKRQKNNDTPETLSGHMSSLDDCRQSHEGDYRRRRDDSSKICSTTIPIIWEFLLQQSGCRSIHGEEGGGGDMSVVDLEATLDMVFSMPTKADELLKKFGIFVLIRLLGSLIAEATKESCTSASLSAEVVKIGEGAEEEDSKSGSNPSPAELLRRCLDYQRNFGFTKYVCEAFIKEWQGSVDSSKSSTSFIMKEQEQLVIVTPSLWLWTTYLEEVAFRHPSNQVFLSHSVSSMDAVLLSERGEGGGGEEGHFAYRDDDVDEENASKKPFPLVVVDMFLHLSVSMKRFIRDHKNSPLLFSGDDDICSDSNERHDDNNSRKHFIKKSLPELYYFSSSLPKEEEEALLRTTTGGDITTNVGSGDQLVGLHDTWLAVLKNLVNLTHACEVNCHILFTSCLRRPNGKERMRDTVIEMAMGLLWELMTIQQPHEGLPGQQNSSGNGLLHHPFRKFVYDSSLFLLTLLSNLIEISSPSLPSTSSATDNGLETSICEDCHDLVVMKEGSVEEVGGMKERCEYYLKCKLPPSSFPTGVRGGISTGSGGSSLSCFLLKALLHETREMVEDFHNIPTSSLTTSSSSSWSSSSSLPLPLDEIVLSTHIILLLFSIHLLIPELVRDDDCSSLCSSMSNFHSSEVLVENGGIRTIRDLLPGGTWWLPLRVLKAYIALQDQTTTLVQENSLPVIVVIQRMQQEDRIVESELKGRYDRTQHI